MFNFKIGNGYLKKLSRLQNQAAFRGINPRRDWILVLIVFILLVISFASFSVYLFTQINSGAGIFLVQRDTISIDTVDRVLLDNTLDFYRGKRIQFEGVRGQTPTIIDPSL